MRDNVVVLGRISGLFGVRGWVRVYSHTRPIENLIAYSNWFLSRSEQGCPQCWQPFRVVNARPHGKTLVAQLADEQGEVIDDRDVAAGLLDAEIAVARADMPPLPAGEYYWHDLVGLEVSNREGVSLGRVLGLMETGANDVLVVRGERERLIPFVMNVIVDSVDVDAGLIKVDWGADY